MKRDRTRCQEVVGRKRERGSVSQEDTAMIYTGQRAVDSVSDVGERGSLSDFSEQLRTGLRWNRVVGIR